MEQITEVLKYTIAGPTDLAAGYPAAVHGRLIRGAAWMIVATIPGMIIIWYFYLGTSAAVIWLSFATIIYLLLYWRREWPEKIAYKEWEKSAEDKIRKFQELLQQTEFPVSYAGWAYFWSEARAQDDFLIVFRDHVTEYALVLDGGPLSQLWENATHIRFGSAVCTLDRDEKRNIRIVLKYRKAIFSHHDVDLPTPSVAVA